MDYVKTLPDEIKLDILTRLPTESVLDSKLVCTNWRKIISNHPSFSKMHLNHHLNHPSSESAGKLGFLVLCRCVNSNRIFKYFEYDDQSTRPIQRITIVNMASPFKHSSFRFVASINGLIYLTDYTNQCVCICNPITREYLILPEIKRDSNTTDGYWYEETCFGYVSSTNEYKIVRFYKSKTHLEVHIYTLGSGIGWRNLGKFNFGLKHGLEYNVFFATGVLYWLDNELKMIGTFNLAEEKFGEHLSPPDSNWCDHFIGVLNGFLFFGRQDQGDRIYDIWILKKKNHNHDKEEAVEHQSLGWIKEFRIDNSEWIELLAITKSGGVITLSDNNYFINLYDTKTSTSKTLVKFNSSIVEAFPHKNTLVSLKELGEEDIKVMESAQIVVTKRHA